jgi:hypothetical protein
MNREQRRLEERKRETARQAPALTEITRGTVVERFLRCGQPGCACQKPGAQGHGPYHYLVVTQAPGKTESILLAPGQVARVRRWTRNFKRLKHLLERLSRLNTRLLRLEREAQRRPGRR